MNVSSFYPLDLKALPGHWEVNALRDAVVEMRPGFASGKHNRLGTGVPHLRPMNVSPNGRLDLTDLKYVDGPNRLRVHQGDVLFNNTNSPEWVGKTAAIHGARDLAFSNHMTRIKVSRRLHPDFLAHQLHYLCLAGYFRQTCTNHVNQASVSLRDLALLPVVLAPFDEQRRIVATIEEQFSRLESSQASLQTAALRLGVLNGLIADRCGANSQHLPVGWSLVTIGQIATVRSGIQKQPKRRPITAAARPYMRVANVHRGRLALEDVQRMELFEGELDTYRLVAGDLLVVEGNGSSTEIGRAALWKGEVPDCVHQNHIIRVRPDPLQVEAGYLEIIWNAPATARRIAAMASSTSGLYVLNSGKVRSLTLALPPIEKQRSMLAEVAKQRVLISRLTLEVTSARRRAQSLRRSILAAAFTGRLSDRAEMGQPGAMARLRLLAGAPL